MHVLLDTHALLWWLTADGRLSVKARDLIADESNDVFVSAVSAWEISTKQRLGKLADVQQASERFTELVAADGFGDLPISPCTDYGPAATTSRIATRLIGCSRRNPSSSGCHWSPVTRHSSCSARRRTGDGSGRALRPR